MMYEQLYQYLISHKQLAIPGVGNFLVERKSAENDFSSKKINPPAYSISFESAGKVPAANFFTWLANILQVSEEKAVNTFNQFSEELKSQISSGNIIDWKGVGVLSKGFGGDIKFKSSLSEVIIEKPVAAEKVIRQKAEHMVRVGEDQKTSTEMSEMLNQEEEKKSYWWAPALVAALLGFVFIGWYFSENGIETSAVANNKTIIPLEAGNTYQIVP